VKILYIIGNNSYSGYIFCLVADAIYYSIKAMFNDDHIVALLNN
jgi:hypothetical protein